MSWGYVAVAGATLVAGKMSSDASSKASSQQAGAAREAGARELEMYNQTKETLMPFITGATGVGGEGGGSYDLQLAMSGAQGPEAQARAYANFQESPNVQFLRDQGMRGIEADLAASGRGGGARLKAISEFNQGLAMQDFGNQFNRLGTLTNVGLSAANALGGVSTAAGQGQAQAALNVGAAQAGGTMGRANAFNTGIGQLAQTYGQYQNANPSSFSGMSGVNAGSQQDMMLAQQNAGF